MRVVVEMFFNVLHPCLMDLGHPVEEAKAAPLQERAANESWLGRDPFQTQRKAAHTRCPPGRRASCML